MDEDAEWIRNRVSSNRTMTVRADCPDCEPDMALMQRDRDRLLSIADRLDAQRPVGESEEIGCVKALIAEHERLLAVSDSPGLRASLRSLQKRLKVIATPAATD